MYSLIIGNLLIVFVLAEKFYRTPSCTQALVVIILPGVSSGIFMSIKSSANVAPSGEHFAERG